MESVDMKVSKTFELCSCRFKSDQRYHPARGAKPWYYCAGALLMSMFPTTAADSFLDAKSR